MYQTVARSLGEGYVIGPVEGARSTGQERLGDETMDSGVRERSAGTAIGRFQPTLTGIPRGRAMLILADDIRIECTSQYRVVPDCPM